MKRFKVLIVLLLVFIFVFISFQKVGAVSVSGNWYDWSNYRFAGQWGNGYLDVRIASNSSYSACTSIVRLENLTYNISYFKINGVNYSVGIDSISMPYYANGSNKVVDIEFKNVPSVKAGDKIEFSLSYSGSQYNNPGYVNVSGSVSFMGKVGTFDTNNYNWFIYDLMQPSFTLIYNNDYNYTSNTASFTMQYSNFSFNYFTLLNTDAVSNGGFGGFHLLSYNISNNKVNCTFDNTYETMQNPHYLFYTVHGLDGSGNPVDLNGSINFNINVDTSPKVKSYKVSYVMDGSPCIAGSGGGRLYLYIDYGSGYVLQDTSKWSAVISQVANGGQDTFTYAIDTNFNTAYKLAITKIDDIDTYNYSIHVNDTGINLTGQLKVCSNDDYVFDSSGSQTSGEETDIFTLLKEIKDIFVGLWNLVLSIVDFFGALLLAIFSIAYSMGVAVISLLKILIDFVASVSNVLFNRNTAYYSLTNIVSLPNSFTYQGKVIGLFGLWGQVDTWLQYIHDNIVIQYGGVWAVISLIYLIRKHILIEKVEDEDE
jgi:hypothetical protein